MSDIFDSGDNDDDLLRSPDETSCEHPCELRLDVIREHLLALNDDGNDFDRRVNSFLAAAENIETVFTAALDRIVQLLSENMTKENYDDVHDIRDEIFRRPLCRSVAQGHCVRRLEREIALQQHLAFANAELAKQDSKEVDISTIGKCIAHFATLMKRDEFSERDDADTIRELYNNLIARLQSVGDQ